MGLPEPKREGDVEEAGQILSILQAYCSHLKMTQDINIWKVIQIDHLLEAKPSGIRDADTAGYLSSLLLDDHLTEHVPHAEQVQEGNLRSCALFLLKECEEPIPFLGPTFRAGKHISCVLVGPWVAILRIIC